MLQLLMYGWKDARLNYLEEGSPEANVKVVILNPGNCQ